MLGTLDTAASIAFNILAGVAIIVGGGWTLWKHIRERQYYSSANVGISAEHIETADGRLVVRAVLAIRNVGKTFMRIDRAFVWIQLVEPFEGTVLDSLASMDEAVADEVSPIAEADWPLLAERTIEFGRGQMDIEPGEQDEIPFEFLLEGGTETVLLYGYVRNASKRHHVTLKRWGPLWRPVREAQELGWSKSKYYHLRDGGE